MLFSFGLAALFALVASVRPGVDITIGEFSPPRSVPTNTGVWFVTGQTEKGPLAPVMIRSLSEYINKFGDRVSYGFLYDALEQFFREGGSQAWISRVVGPAAVSSSFTLKDASTVNCLVVSAIGPGAWGNNLKIAVLAGSAGGTFVLQVSDTNGILETSPDLLDKAAAFAWAQYSDYIVLTDAASLLDPAVIAAQSLIGGTDDRASITDTEWLVALNRFYPGLGPGQVSAPGRTTDTGHTQLVQHAVAQGRRAVLDAPDTNTVATIKASAAGAGSALDRRYAGLFWPWESIPGLTSGTTRTVPPSAHVSGAIAKNIGNGMSPSAPSAGVKGESRYALGVSRPAAGEVSISEIQRQDLNSSGVNVIRVLFGAVRIYGWRSLTNPVTDPDWLDFGAAGVVMAIEAEAGEIMEGFMFGEIDGKGHYLGDLKAALNGMLLRWYNEGSLFGESPDDAFYVDVGNQVNTQETLAANEVHALISIRTSPFAELIQLTIIKKPITEAVV